MHTIAVINQKGGCGKTTTAVNLAAALAARGERTLLLDVDPQAHASLALGIVDDGSETSAYDLFVDPYVSIDDVIRHHSDQLDIVPGIVILHAVEQILSGAPNRENRLRKKLEPIAAEYQFAIIDCPPAVGITTINALSAAHQALVPVEASFFALHGMARLLETIGMVERETGKEIDVRALCTMFDGRTKLAHEVYQEACRHLGDKMYSTVIRVNVKLREAASHGKPVIDYAPHSKGAEDYAALAAEVSKRISPSTAALSDVDAAIAGSPAALNRVLAEARDSALLPVDFSIYAPQAERVYVAGDWNEWSASADALSRETSSGLWSARLRLSPGSHRYRFLVDGVPMSDPANDSIGIGPTGERISVVHALAAEPSRDEHA